MRVETGELGMILQYNMRKTANLKQRVVKYSLRAKNGGVGMLRGEVSERR